MKTTIKGIIAALDNPENNTEFLKWGDGYYRRAKLREFFALLRRQKITYVEIEHVGTGVTAWWDIGGKRGHATFFGLTHLAQELKVDS